MTKKDKKFDRRPNRPFPRHSLEEASIIAQAIQNNNAGKPMKRLLVADAINRKPTSPEFRDLLSSSFKYGLTNGTEKAENIELTELGKQITKPTSPEMEMQTRQKAILFSETFKMIFSHFKDNKFPKGQFFENSLETQFNIPREYVKEINTLLEKNGIFAGIIRNISGSPHVMFDNTTFVEPTVESNTQESILVEENPGFEAEEVSKIDLPSQPQIEKKVKKIFISHGKNKKIMEQIKIVLEYGGFEPIVAVLQETTAIPVPEKIMNIMHECSAGIINISADEMYKDEAGNEKYKINENVLIEIGAAFVLYKTKVILVVDKRLGLPSNLQGLSVCHYEGDSLDFDSVLKLQKALIGFNK